MEQKPEFSLSADFRDRALVADRLSYRFMTADIARPVPDHPHLLYVFSWQGYDRIETGLRDLVLARAAIENPGLAPALIPFMSAAKDLRGAARDVRSRFALAAKGPAPTSSEISQLRDRTDRALDSCLKTVAGTADRVRVRFDRDNANEPVRVLESNLRPDRYVCMRDRVRDWLYRPLYTPLLNRDGSVMAVQEQMPALSATITGRAVENDDELAQARADVAAATGADNAAGLLTPRRPGLGGPALILK